MKGVYIGFVVFSLFSSVYSVRIMVNTSEISSPLLKFWRSTGFSPQKSDELSVKDYILSKEVKINLALISSLPLQGITYIRIHWLLSLLSQNEDGSINWLSLDIIIETIVGNGLKPIIELMGNSKFLNDQKNKRVFWFTITSQLASRYIGKYGEYELSRWKFETWNEPDLKMYNVLNFTLQEYIHYTDGCISGLKSVLPSIKVGGPAGLFKNKDQHPLCWGFLNYCNASKFRCNIDYISLHKKGNGTSSEILKETLKVRKFLTRYYTNISHLPIVNDESDILTGWWRTEEWRGDARYAAAVVKTIFIFKRRIKNMNIERISFDNGFLNIPPNFFNQRTLVTRFVRKDGTNMFVQKPVYGAMGLMALLGEEEIPTQFRKDKRISLFVTCTKDKPKTNILSLSILIAVSSDKMEINITDVELEYNLMLPNSWESARYVIYALNNKLPSPKQLWEKNGSPSIPDKSLLKTLQNCQEPHTVSQGIVKGSQFKESYFTPQPSIVLLHVCQENVGMPGKVTNVKAFNMSYNEVLLTWKEAPSDGRCIKTFIVEHSKINMMDIDYRRVNEENIIFNSFYYTYEDNGAIPEQTRGFYRVTAIDYWGRKGTYSDSIIYNA